MESGRTLWKLYRRCTVSDASPCAVDGSLIALDVADRLRLEDTSCSWEGAEPMRKIKTLILAEGGASCLCYPLFSLSHDPHPPRRWARMVSLNQRLSWQHQEAARPRSRRKSQRRRLYQPPPPVAVHLQEVRMVLLRRPRRRLAPRPFIPAVHPLPATRSPQPHYLTRLRSTAREAQVALEAIGSHRCSAWQPFRWMVERQ